MLVEFFFQLSKWEMKVTLTLKWYMFLCGKYDDDDDNNNDDDNEDDDHHHNQISRWLTNKAQSNDYDDGDDDDNNDGECDGGSDSNEFCVFI